MTIPQRKTISKGQLLIAGKRRDASSGETMTTTDPTTEAPITQVAKATPEDAKQAVQAAYSAFEDGPWPKMHHEERAKIMFRIADLMDERREEFALLEAMDIGMPHCPGLFPRHVST